MKNDYRDYIMHHGIKGMHWGERNGPPYPLDDDISTGKKLKDNQKSNNENNLLNHLNKDDFDIDEHTYSDAGYYSASGHVDKYPVQISWLKGNKDQASKTLDSYNYFKKHKSEVIKSTSKAMEKFLNASNDNENHKVYTDDCDFFIQSDHISMRYCDYYWGWLMSDYYPSVKKTKTYFI